MEDPRIFISYRRDDAAGDAGRLYDTLVGRFGKGSIFMDVTMIQPGADFADVISEAVGSCEVLVTVIGKTWLSQADDGGRRRLDDPQDLVRLEIQSALEHKIRVVPALVQGAQMPRADQLPASLAKLAGKNAFEISHARWQSDVERLISALERPKPQIEASLHNLPRQLTSFVGRSEDVAAARRTLLAARLLTLTGAGGIGKSRLAIQVAGEIVKDFRDGVWLVELAPIAAPDLVPKAVAVALGVPEQSGREIAETLTDYLRPRQILLVLDNCEHLVGAVARLVDSLLRACPDLRTLATSREALGIGGEQISRVRSLSVPEPVSQTAADDVAEYEAIALFCDRAATAVGSFTVTQQNAPLVVQICRRLDGIPLAIELAAARLKVLSLEQIVIRLDDRFRLLTGGSRTALRRQQTLRATIDWSYQLLSEAERAMLRRLSVFAGGASLEAAEAICAGDIVDGDEVLDLLAELISKSMVLIGDGDGEARYRLLETIRQYGLDQLRGMGEAEAVRRRHRDWFLSLAERAEGELKGLDQLSWSELLELELENLRAAFEWSIQANETEACLRLAVALGRFWYTRSHLSDGDNWLNRSLARNDGSQNLRARAVVWAAAVASYLGDVERATRLAQESLEMFRQASDQRGVGFALQILGTLAYGEDEHERGRTLLQESLAARRDAGDMWGIAQSLFFLGQMETFAGAYGVALAQLDEALTLFRELGDRRYIAVTVATLGRVSLFQGRYVKAAAQLEEAIGLLRELNDRAFALNLVTLGTILRCQGNFDLANSVLRESLDLFRKLGAKHHEAYSLCQLGIVARLEGDLLRAEALLQETVARPKDRYVLSQCLEALAAVACQQGQLLRGATLFGAAQGMRDKIALPLDPWELDDHKAIVAAALGDLGKTEYRRAWLAGHAMSPDEATTFASQQPATPVGERLVTQ